MDITLTFVSLGHEQIGNMSANTVFITDSISSKDFLQYPCVDKSTIAVLPLDHTDHFWCSFALIL